jgi:hypothetical protein
MLTVTIVLLAAAFICTVGAAWNAPKVPLWIAVLLVVIILALQVLPK